MVSLIPISGAAGGINYEAYASTDEALEALAAIKPVDRSARATSTVDLATEACRRNTKLTSKRIVLIADQQISGWSTDPENQQLKSLPAPIQVIEVLSEKGELIARGASAISSVELSTANAKGADHSPLVVHRDELVLLMGDF